MDCKNCCYCYIGEGDTFACCHYEGDVVFAPCEYDSSYDIPDERYDY